MGAILLWGRLYEIAVSNEIFINYALNGIGYVRINVFATPRTLREIVLLVESHISRTNGVYNYREIVIAFLFKSTYICILKPITIVN